jgi:hypothetical protein
MDDVRVKVIEIRLELLSRSSKTRTVRSKEIEEKLETK